MRGFPVEIDLEEGENNPEGLNDGENENVLDEAEVESGYVPTTPPKSDQGSDREPAEKRPRDYEEEKMVPRLPEPEPDSDYHWRNISEYRPQAKGVERAVGIAKEGIYTNWLAFESKCQCRIALESPLLGYLVGYVYRTFNIFCDRYRSGTPLDQ